MLFLKANTPSVSMRKTSDKPKRGTLQNTQTVLSTLLRSSKAGRLRNHHNKPVLSISHVNVLRDWEESNPSH
jgi:hypothetical protein